MLLVGFVEAGYALNAHIVGLGGARSEYDFLGVCANEARNVGTGLFGRLFGLPAVCVGTRMGITVEASEVRKHGVENTGVGWSGGLHVEVNGAGAFIHNCGLLKDSCEQSLSILPLK